MNIRDPKAGVLEELQKIGYSISSDYTVDKDLRKSLRSYVGRINSESGSFILKRSFVIDLKFEALLLQMLKENKIPVPNVLGYFSSSKMLLLEDLGDESLETSNIKKVKIKEAISILSQIHCIGLDHHKKLQQLYSIDYSKIKFDVSKYKASLTQVCLERLIKYYFKQETDPQKLQRLKSLFYSVIQYLTISYKECFDFNIPSFLIINDLKPHHFLIDKGALKIIDLERASNIGLPQYDLVFLLEDPILKFNNEFKIEIINYYISCLESLINRKIDRELFQTGYLFYKIIYNIFLSEVTEKAVMFNDESFVKNEAILEIINIIQNESTI